ncbi:hypothetical protein FE257_006899 [Aspergillus nanangensis]|uniref:Fumarate reductase n=1 Tax=Aspergillus nanangensis TaxID=2582783 RepID=A0AAD4CNJ5_ASPNN|nr:hypothetical protein FE257_006899 [Aspergillus nanangensis]
MSGLSTPSALLQASPAIVVGSGLAGLSAASQLIFHHVPVVMLDRAPKPGGNSIKASSGINGAPTRFQPCDTEDTAFYTDTVVSAGRPLSSSTSTERLRREQLIATLTQSSPSAVYWLTDDNAIDLSKVAQLGGHSHPRTHRGAGKKPPGSAIITTLLDSLTRDPLFELRTQAKVTKVLREADEVTGVEYKSPGTDPNATTRLSGPVVFATGGFAGDAQGMMMRYRPDLAGLPSTNDAREGSQPLLEQVGAAVVDMDQVQVHPTGFVDPADPAAPVKFLAAEALRGEGGILLLEDGKRFANELGNREQVTNALMKAASRLETPTRQWEVTLLLDEGAATALAAHLEFYVWKGLMRKTTVGELGKTGCQTVCQTVQEYADAAAGRTEDAFGRKAFGNWSLGDVQSDSVVYVGKVTPVTHFTMGGVVFNEYSQVLDQSGGVIRGLWAAGEVTGGLHGQNRLGGSSLLECVVFGRIAGNAAAAFHQKHYKTVP